jgi:hypothetical protein
MHIDEEGFACDDDGRPILSQAAGEVGEFWTSLNRLLRERDIRIKSTAEVNFSHDGVRGRILFAQSGASIEFDDPPEDSGQPS